MKYLTLSVIALITLFMCACKKDNGNKTTINPPQPKAKNYRIVVVDENNQPVANAKISDGSTAITTNTSGAATFNTPGETYGKYRFSIIKDGYFSGSLNLLTFADPDSSSKVMLLKSADTVVVPSSGGTVTGTAWTLTSTGGFKYANGAAVAGDVNISIRYIRPDSFDLVRSAFPGQDFTGLSGTTESLLYIYGWVAIIYTQNGVRVYPLPGSVNIKVQVPGIYANAAQSGGQVFYYDEAAGIWEESAYPTVSGLDVTMPLPSEASFCALGKQVPTTTIKYTRTSCMIAGNGYAVQIELDMDRLNNYLNSIPGHHWDLWQLACVNSGLGANLYPSGFALGGYNTWYGRGWSSTDGTYGYSIEDFPGIETETFTYPTGFDGAFRVHSIQLPLLSGHEIEPLSDKIIKEYSMLPAGLTNLGRLNTVCDSVIANPHNNNNNNNTNTTTGSGQFTYNGQTVSGTCTSTPAQTSGCTGIDLVFSGSESFVIKNMPAATSGTFTVNGTGSNCNPYAATLWGGASQSTSGTVTKTGAKSFSFSISMENISSGITTVATGSGSYN